MEVRVGGFTKERVIFAVVATLLVALATPLINRGFNAVGLTKAA